MLHSPLVRISDSYRVRQLDDIYKSFWANSDFLFHHTRYERDYPTTSKFTKGTSTVSPSSSFTSAACARNPLGKVLNPAGRKDTVPIMPAFGGRRRRTACPVRNGSKLFGSGGSPVTGNGMITSGRFP